MSNGMRATNPRFVKGGRKLKKTKHCTIPKTLITEEKILCPKTILLLKQMKREMQSREYAVSCTKIKFGGIIKADISRKERDEG